MKKIKLKENLENKIQNLDRKISIENFKSNEKKRKQRAHQLIQLGTLFEITELLEVKPHVLLGYLANFPKENLLRHDEFEELGSEIMRERILEREKKKKKKQEKYQVLEISEIKELLNLGREKNIDVVFLAQENFKKKLLENLTRNQFEILKNMLLKN
ncbi:MAG: conjugal transfer protein TraD [Bacilli bacterium]